MKRRCGWLGNEEASEAPLVWARGRNALTTCPRSYITAESIALIEEFQAWKLCGGGNVYDFPARLVHAILILENEVRAQSTDGQN